MTKRQLEKFIARRNNSEFQSNLQFSFDLAAEGIKMQELGKCVFDPKDKSWGWDTKFGKLKEIDGQLMLQ